MLDTSIAVELLRKPRQPLLYRVTAEQPGSGMISSVAVAELWYGVDRSRERVMNCEVVSSFLQSLEVLSFDETAARVYGALRADLGSRGQVIGAIDMLIAAHALSLDCTLVTGNVREFSRVRGLRVEDWGASL